MTDEKDNNPITAEIHRCRECGTLWRRWQDGSWSLIENKPAGKCCDNVAMGAQIEQLWPLQARIAALEGELQQQRQLANQNAYAAVHENERANALSARIAALEGRETDLIAALKTLIEKWQLEGEQHKKHGDSYRIGQGWGLVDCADQLSALLADPASRSPEPDQR